MSNTDWLKHQVLISNTDWLKHQVLISNTDWLKHQVLILVVARDAKWLPEMQLLLALKVLRYVIYEDNSDFFFQENDFPCFTQYGNITELMSTTFSSNERVVIPANTLSIGTRYTVLYVIKCLWDSIFSCV